MARKEKVGWKKINGKVSGEVSDAVGIIAGIQRRDVGNVADDLLRKAGVLDILRDLLQERLAALAIEMEKLGKTSIGLAPCKSHSFQNPPEPPRGKDKAGDRVFADLVFAELDRTNRICQLESGLKSQGLSVTPKEIDAWRRAKHIPFENREAILRFIAKPERGKGNIKPFPRKKGAA